MGDEVARRLANWLKSYRDYCVESEAPDMFHMWVGLTVLSATTRRNINFQHGYRTIFPNLYTVLVSPPGTCRKGEAMELGKNLLEGVSSVKIEANKLTTEALINSLSGGVYSLKPPRKKGQPPPALQTVTIQQTCAGLIYSEELGVTIGSDCLQTGLLQNLTQFFDCPKRWEYETRGRGKETLYNIYLTLMGATIPDWIATTLPEGAITGGFTSRVIFIAQTERRFRKSDPNYGPHIQRIKNDLTHDLNHMANLSGTMVWSPDAKSYYSHWYETVHDEMMLGPNFSGYMSRKPVHLIKTSMLLALSESDRPVIELHHMAGALALLNQVEDYLPSAFKSVGLRDITRIMAQLDARGGMMDLKTITRENLPFLDRRRFGEIIAQMLDAELIEEVRAQGGVKYFKVKKRFDSEVRAHSEVTGSTASAEAIEVARGSGDVSDEGATDAGDGDAPRGQLPTGGK